MAKGPAGKTAQSAALMQQEKRLRRILEAPIVPTLARMSVPNIGVSSAQLAVAFADAWYVGRLGVAPLAALALIFPIQMLMQMMAGGGIGGGVSSAVARALGRGDVGRAEAVIVHGLVIAVVMAAFFTVAFGIFARPVFALFGGQGPALEGAVAYAGILFGGAAFIWLANVMASVLRGTGDMLGPARILIATAGIGVVLSGILTLGWFGVPAIGIRGPAVAFVVAQSIAMLAMFYHLWSGRAGITLHLSGLRLRWVVFYDIIRVGAVASGNAILTIVTVIIVTALVGRYGVAALAGYGLGSRLELMMIPLSFGVGGALTAIVGTCHGNRRYRRARHAAWVGGLFVFGLAAVIGAVVALFPQLWTGLFTEDPGAANYGASYLRIVGPFYAFFGLGMTLYFASQGTGNMLWPFTAGILRFAIAAGIGGMAAAWWGASLEVVFGCVAAGLAVFGGVIALSLFGRVWNPATQSG